MTLAFPWTPDAPTEGRTAPIERPAPGAIANSDPLAAATRAARLAVLAAVCGRAWPRPVLALTARALLSDTLPAEAAARLVGEALDGLASAGVLVERGVRGHPGCRLVRMAMPPDRNPVAAAVVTGPVGAATPRIRIGEPRRPTADR
ncbi:MAG: hypothetical protein RID91_12025 [Azospirillaceae bacterium]